MNLTPVIFTELNARQKENYNFHKVSSRMADYGYYCMWLNDDWQGADFIASHVDGSTFLRVQLKSRLMIANKYVGKGIYIAFRDENVYYLYLHDELLERIVNIMPDTEKRRSWTDDGYCSWGRLTVRLKHELRIYEI